VAYKNDIEKFNKDDKESYVILEWHYMVRLMIDYVSGMTDDFEFKEFKILFTLK